MNEWIERQRAAAGVRPGDDPTPHLDKIAEWQSRAREVADEASQHGNKKAVREVTPDAEEARAIFRLYALWAEDIWHTAKDIYDSYVQSGHADEPSLTLDDALQESYPIFQRAMVQAETKHGALNRLEARLAEYVESQLVIPENPDEHSPVEDRDPIAPGFDLVKVYDELHREGKLPGRAAALWERLGPDSG